MDRPDSRPTEPQVDPALFRGLTQRRYSRRDMLRFAGMGGGALAASAVLSACGVSGGKAKKTATSFWDGKTRTGELVFANWPYYMDKAKGRHPSLDRFTQETGIQVKYKEVINDNAEFFGRIQPGLAAGQGTGYDIIVLTNGVYLDKLIQANYLIPLDHSQLPNFAKYAGPAIKDPSYDPGNKYTLAWQSGMTGIGWNPEYVDGPFTSYEDLFDPKYKGKIGMFGDTQDLPNLALVGMGLDPQDATPDDWRKAAEKLKKQRPLVRQYYNQNYIGPLSKGDIWITMAWSGDIFQANASNPGLNLQWALPDQGGLIWTDNMCIPIKAPHPVDALEYMNFVYDPSVAAMIAEWVNYITPVPDAKAVIEQDAAKAKGDDRKLLQDLAASPLIFPDSEIVSRLHNYRVLTTDEEKEWNTIFEPIYQG
jgi:spermidine/putrescine transport system substrate-binding protein